MQRGQRPGVGAAGGCKGAGGLRAVRVHGDSLAWARDTQ